MVTTTKKSKSKSDDFQIKEFYKARHGFKFQCEFCGYKLVGGGYGTLQKRDDIEKEARKEHDKLHKQVLESGKGKTVTVEENGQFVEQIPPLKVSRYTHKAEAEHTFVEQTTKQTTTSTTYATPTGCTISSGSFDVGQTYLHVVTATIDSNSTSAETKVRCVSGSTVHADSEQATEIDSAAGNTHTYMWWLVRTAVSGEDFHVELATSTATTTTAGIDQVCILIFRLTPDLVLNTDFAHNVTTTDTTLGTDNTDSTSNNATITLTPATAAHKWLILSKARYGPGILNTTSPQSRIHRSGEATSDAPVVSQEGEDNSNSIHVLCGARVDTLGAASNTYTEISKNVGTSVFSSVTRTDSGIFMMDLDNFRNVAVNQEDTPQEEPNSTSTPHGVLVHTQSITPAIAGNVWILAHTTMDAGGSGTQFTMRLQIDNTDQPATQTSDAYNYNCWTTEDSVCWATQTVENLTAASHTADIDGSVGVTGASRGTLTRLLMLMTFEFVVSTGLTTVKNETEAITEVVVTKIGTAGKQVKNETEAITETVIPIVQSTLGLIQDQDIVFRMSGGTSNTTLANSIGGARSTQAGGIITTKLFDDVSISEASTGDTEYRCFYIYNAHASLTASSVKIWIPTNTPAQDEIDIGLGSSAVNGTEQGPLANEQTAPSSVTFVVANSEATAINCGTLPAGQHRAIWLRRIVPASAAFFPNNTYQLQVSLYSDHG